MTGSAKECPYCEIRREQHIETCKTVDSLLAQLQEAKEVVKRYGGQLASTDDGSLRMIAYEFLSKLQGPGLK